MEQQRRAVQPAVHRGLSVATVAVTPASDGSSQRLASSSLQPVCMDATLPRASQLPAKSTGPRSSSGGEDACSGGGGVLQIRSNTVAPEMQAGPALPPTLPLDGCSAGEPL